MELFTVCLLPSNEQEVWKLSRYLSEAFAPLHMAAGSDVLKWDIDAGQGRISCFELPGISSPPLARPMSSARRPKASPTSFCMSWSLRSCAP